MIKKLILCSCTDKYCFAFYDSACGAVFLKKILIVQNQDLYFYLPFILTTAVQLAIIVGVCLYFFGVMSRFCNGFLYL